MPDSSNGIPPFRADPPKLLPLGIRVKEAAWLYKVEHSKDFGSTLFDWELEKPVYFGELIHPSHVSKIGFNSDKELDSHTLDRLAIVRPHIYTDGSHIKAHKARRDLSKIVVEGSTLVVLGLLPCENTSEDGAESAACSSTVHDRVYVNTLVVALSCLPVAIWVGLTINLIGKKLMLILMLMSSGLAVLGLNLVRSALHNLILSCVFEAIVSCTEAVLFCVICEIFPTKVA
ncbi:hypothetical protein EVAR_40227_1 [Eumeta japonica]|uniref:Uncharacterized protein n=1 Tax=Eumeta variegata TaxID=151549 RepID=A0A4C1X9K7_EUMVA|nr:hypothetical protein EVAR_40227_1 [Eumeta japonica]